MKLLWIATKAPWPPVDGGRRLLFETLSALAAAGVRARLVAPAEPLPGWVSSAEVQRELDAVCDARLVAARPRRLGRAILVAFARGEAVTSARHDIPEVAAEVTRSLADFVPDVVVAEPLQALAQATPAFANGIPVVLRAENVESDLAAARSAAGRGFAGRLLRREARLLEMEERAALGRVAATFALSSEDAARLTSLAAGAARIEVVRAPFPAELPPASTTLSGRPAIVLFGSAGWAPNSEGARRFLDEFWPVVSQALPEAVLHVFGEAPHRAALRGSVVLHPGPRESGEAFASNSILALPLFAASGVRLRLLEAWARGVAVVATSAAALGSEATDGKEVLLADSPEEFAAAVRRLVEERDLAARFTARGRARLRASHDPGAIAARFLDLARQIASDGKKR